MTPAQHELLRALLESAVHAHPEAAALLPRLGDADLEEEARSLAAAVRARHRSETEIERKYLLNALPPAAAAARSVAVDQGYLPGKKLRERLRHVRADDGDHFVRAMKLGSGMARLEIEEETTREMFDAMWPLTRGRRVAKRRHYVPEGAVTWEIDDFTDRELVLAEVELTDEAQTVTIPDWLAPYLVREVTGEREYLNSRLAK